MDCTIAPFEILFLYYGKQYRAKVQQVFISDLNERFIVTGGSKQIEIISDRPFLRRTNSRKKITFQAVNFSVEHMQLAITIIDQIREHIRRIERPPYDWSAHPKNSGM